MKYYILNEDYNNCKNSFLENRNSFDFRVEYYEGKLFNPTEAIEISFNKDVKNKYLPLKVSVSVVRVLLVFPACRETNPSLRSVASPQDE